MSDEKEMTETEKIYDKYGSETTSKSSVGSVITSIILIVAVCICLYVSVQVATKGYVNIFGNSIFHVVTESMEPTIKVGAVLVCHETDISTIEKDDIVCFKSLDPSLGGMIITHRVIDSKTNETGNHFLVTKGDANLSTDPYYVEQSNLIGKVTWYSGEESILTVLAAIVTDKIGFMACIVIPILLIAGIVMIVCVHRVRKQLYETMREINRNEKKKALVPGFKTITVAEYEEMYKRLHDEILVELRKYM